MPGVSFCQDNIITFEANIKIIGGISHIYLLYMGRKVLAILLYYNILGSSSRHSIRGQKP